MEREGYYTVDVTHVGYQPWERANLVVAAATCHVIPWDQATLTPDGRLELLKGDRALEVEYRVSSTDEIGALKLARVAMRRLAAAKP